MLNLKNEIGKIINEHDFIVLPGIGAFISEYTQPYFDLNNHIVESIKTLKFNSLLSKDVDNKLINLLSIKLGIPFNILHIDYQEFKNYLLLEIEDHNKYSWKNVGIFYKNTDGKLDFYREKIENTDSDLNLIISETQPKEIIQENSNTDSIIKNSDSNSELLNVKMENEINKIVPFNFKKKILYALPILMLFSGLLYIVFFKKDEPQLIKKGVFTGIDQVDTITDISFEKDPILKSEETTDIKDKNESSKNVLSKNSQVKDSSQIENEKSENILISIGIFMNKENVDNLTSYLAENGIPVKFRREKKYYRVFVNANSKAQAIEYSDKIEQLTGEKPVFEK